MSVNPNIPNIFDELNVYIVAYRT